MSVCVCYTVYKEVISWTRRPTKRFDYRGCTSVWTKASLSF